MTFFFSSPDARSDQILDQGRLANLKRFRQELITKRVQPLHIPDTAFSQTDEF